MPLTELVFRMIRILPLGRKVSDHPDGDSPGPAVGPFQQEDANQRGQAAGRRPGLGRAFRAARRTGTAGPG
jgi:hypothetical protein